MLFFAKREPLRFLPTAKQFLFQKTAQSLERGRRAFSTHNGQQRPTTRKEAFSNPQNRSIRAVLLLGPIKERCRAIQTSIKIKTQEHGARKANTHNHNNISNISCKLNTHTHTHTHTRAKSFVRIHSLEKKKEQATQSQKEIVVNDGI